MSRSEAISELKRMWVVAGIIGVAVCALMFLMMASGGGLGDMGIGYIILMFIMFSISGALVAGGIPIGWRWASNFITAISFYGVITKILIAMFLGWFALLFYTIKYIVIIIKER